MKQKLSKNIETLLRDFINKHMEEKYNKFYVGKVVDNNDPERKYRCRIRVYGIYGDQIPDEDLPWAIGDMGFVGSNIGSVVIPPIDAIVRVRFENGDIYSPVYISKVFDNNNQSFEVEENYPDKILFFETDNGDYFTIDRKTFETSYHTATGVLITVDAEGSVTVNTEDTEIGTIAVKDQHGNSTLMDDTGITMEDKNGNILDMKSGGVTINGHYLATKEFLDDLISTFSTVLGPGNLGAPVPIWPATLSTMTTKVISKDIYTTDKP